MSIAPPPASRWLRSRTHRHRRSRAGAGPRSQRPPVSALSSPAHHDADHLAATSPGPAHSAAPAVSTVTVTAGPPPSPAPLPVAEADAQTCRAWGTTDKFVTAGAASMASIPNGMNITDPAVQNNPAWKASVTRASDLFGQAADTFQAQIAAGTNPMLAQVADTTVSSLRTLSEAYKTFDPISGNAVPVFQANQKAIDWLCR